MNMFASVGDALFVIHDWLFTEQFFFASLAMPIAVNVFNLGEEEVRERKARAKRLTIVARYSFYLLLLSWFLVSTITGKFLYRMSINIIFFYITLVFTLSLCRIKS